MIAYFYKGKFFGTWQDQQNESEWLKRTARALGHNLNDVEARHFGLSLRNDQSFIFNEDKDIVLINREEVKETVDVEEEVETEIVVSGKKAFTKELKVVQKEVSREILSQQEAIKPSLIIK